ncbi:alanine--tRNA ligase [Melissococcus plutonius]|uniref:Alanine--tRNA ligase n=1 Tax=Melissococcus plutonius (strain ATCC 35311 / DSM 29964 / CIP 104052 / LMG 20360 / NCIMB 702443) TaxID=940190 RepID=F3YA87_MELPT|nr:alanine--tRNA ligase [Melissococcus plutonius]KMT32225.1 alanine--tRNA ligase AlaS [Melissococcus plutonius]KMT34796.1 alanine--tRNA ligase AlaS [Melissococcus plutonius]KMT40727.1 alanine--tRNA ligase AlaS [Melissococcus plutonius]MBB5176822.1 alanyl-tRNA synthetase [Melissococcus plutonius]BAK21415.1 alanyl-tRNA synthetase [Melissococcus plutonius ATCC 35311]
MKQLSSSQIRQMFLDFFKSKGHSIEPSASLIPVNDPTLLWINSGVATLKKYFDGSIVPENPRITNAQKSIRTNDIENVGKTARHHTMFEMLGNFSIGDYFKEEAIHWAWEFLTSPKWMAFDPQKLYVTVYPKDQETKRIWHEEMKLPLDHIIELEDNFWDIGSGPSGPDTEIFYDRGAEFLDIPENDPENFPGGENERYLEIWNLVFSEFNHTAEDTFEPLPHKNIDTGMGLERMVSIVQEAPTNFETDLFLPIIHEIEKLSGKAKYGENPQIDISFKVIADHIRALSFAIGDGALPSNEGSGYVLRRLLRRAVMHGKKLGIDQAFLYQLVSIVGEIMVSYYPEILRQKTFIEKVIRTEEERFNETINDGLGILNDLMEQVKLTKSNTLDGKSIFKLYDTYGFPVELTEEIATDAGLTVDHMGFEEEMKVQRERARKARNNETSMNVQSAVLTDIKVKSTFVGYEVLDNASELLVLLQNKKMVDTVEKGMAELIFAETPFYAEMGGQVADHGIIEDGEGNQVAYVIDVQKAPNGQTLHKVEVTQPMIEGNIYQLHVDKQMRTYIMKNHTATHLLHRALKDVLGEHATQAGSLVDADHLRFDFTHFGQVTEEELRQMEKIVNEKIWAAMPVNTVETDINTAKSMGAMALFGEKYGHEVRVVTISDYSLELCGGTHVSNTEDIGIFKIVSESGIGAGTRRIDAVTSKEAYRLLSEEEDQLKEVAKLVKSSQLKETVIKVEQQQQLLRELQKENDKLASRLASQEGDAAFKEIHESHGVSYITAQVKVKDTTQLRQLADQWKQKQLSDLLVLVTTQADKVNLLVAMSEELNQKGLKAGDLIKAIAPKVGGSGGGRPNMAQAGGKNPAGIPEAFSEVEHWLTENA